MIELPRACFVADRIAQHADFFSFGTNDLTQTALGSSRDDAEGRPRHSTSTAKAIERRARSRRSTSPASAGSRASPPGSAAQARPDLKLGICGEHGGDPESVAFFHAAGLVNDSCSPHRRPDRPHRRRPGRTRRRVVLGVEAQPEAVEGAAATARAGRRAGRPRRAGCA